MTHTPTRRLLALLLAVATVFSLLSMSVSAADEQTGPEIELVNTATEPLKKDSKFHVAVKIKDSTFAFSNFGIYLIFDTEALNLDQIITAYVNSEGDETDYLPNLTGNTKQVVHEGVTYGGVVQMASAKNVKPKKQTLFILEFSAKKCLTAPVEVTLHVDTFQSVNDDNTFTDYTPQITPAQITISHTLTGVPAKDETCTEDGNTAYWTCSACEKWFSDENGTTEITDKDSVVKKATGHTPSAAWSYDGTYHWHVCTTCSEVLDKAAHRGGTATCSEQAACEACGQKYGATTEHDYQWNHDAAQHWKECSACSAIDPANPKTNHNFGECVTEKEATCTETGTQKRTCADCGYSETAEIAMIAHTLTHHEAVTPTCTTTGSIEYWECSACGKKFSDAACTIEVTDVTLPMAAHTLTKTDAKAATCTEAGHAEYWTCSACGTWFLDESGENEITDHNSVVIPATGHTADATGWHGDDTDHWHVCTTCGETFDKEAHSGGHATCSKKATCEVCGLEYGSTTDHDYQWQHDNTEHWKACKDCGAVDENTRANHTFGGWVTEKDSTCTETGTKKRTCTACDYSETGVIEKKAHTADHHDRVEPTCTTMGSIEYWQCSVCGKKFSNADCTVEVTDVTLPMAAHTLTKTDAKAATCTEAGNAEYWTCSVCKKLFSDSEGKNEITAASVVIPATGHTADDSGWNSNGTNHWHVCATCKEKFDEAAHTGGTATCSSKAVCDVCKAEYGTTTAHTFISKHDDTQHWKECSACGAIDPANPKTNHTFGEWETVTDSTCTATGTKKHTCTGCDYSETGVIEKKAHTTEHHDRVDPTCTTTGSIEYWQCSVCGKMFSDAACTTEVTDVTLDKLPHSAGTAWEKDTTYHWHLCTSCGSEVMDKAVHTYGDWVTVAEATETEAGLRKRTCSVCGYEQTEEIGILRFTVTVRNGSGSGEYKSGETVTITADRRSGYTFEKWTVDSGNVTLSKETDSTTTFTMPAENVTVTASYRYNGGSGSGSSGSNIVIKDENGNVLGKADPDTGIVELPIPPVPAASSSRQAEELEITIPKNTIVKVEIPVRNVTPGTVVVIVHADGTEEIVRTSIVTKNGVALELTSSATVKVYDNSKFFSDVPAANWASDAVAFVSSRELFNGTGANTFSPNAPMTRQMLMTVLARLDGTDTSGNAYAKGMEWAIRNGVSNGSDPEGKITREQLATMLWRYAGSPSVSGRMTGFVDADQISGYAEDAMLWATKAGIIGGKGNGQLDPKGYATRAEVAAMLMRYCNTLFTK